MSKYSWLLNIIKYLGLVIASTSTIWSATNITSKEIDGKKELTTAGKVSIAFTISGLLISITSIILEDRIKSSKAAQEAIREIKRTNKIILSGQPLTSLSLQIECYEKNQDFTKLMDRTMNDWQEETMNQQGEVSNSKGDAIQFAYGVLPLFIYSIKGKEETKDNFLYLMSFGDNQNSIISFGYIDSLDEVITWDNSNVSSSPRKKRGRELSKGIMTDEEVWKPVYYGGDRKLLNQDFFSTDGKIYFTWNLDSNTLFNCLDNLNPNISLTAHLPSVIKIAILYDIVKIPARSQNLTSTFDSVWISQDLMEESEKPLSNIYSNSTLTITPNGLDGQSTKYSLSNVSYKDIFDEEWVETLYCKEILLIYERLNDEG